MNSNLKKVFDETINEIKPFVDQIDFEQLSKHSRSYIGYQKNPINLVTSEINRYYKSYNKLSEYLDTNKPLNVCELGCYIPFFPIVLSKLGHKVTIVENFNFYTENFLDMLQTISVKYSIVLKNIDIVSESFSELGKFDAMFLLSLVEHLHGSPLQILLKIHDQLNMNGIFVFDVPNIAAFHKRIRMIIGISPMPDYSNYVKSAYPFVGHHREMTVKEVEILMKEANFEIQYIENFEYLNYDNANTFAKSLSIIRNYLPIKNAKQHIIALSKPI